MSNLESLTGQTSGLPVFELLLEDLIRPRHEPRSTGDGVKNNKSQSEATREQ